MATLGTQRPVADRLASSRQSAAHWFAYKLRSELRGGDPLAPLVIDGVRLALLAEFIRAPGARIDRVARACEHRTWDSLFIRRREASLRGQKWTI